MFATTAAVSPLCTNTNMCCTKGSYCYYYYYYYYYYCDDNYYD